MRLYLEATAQRRVMLPVWLPGAAAKAIRKGAALSPGRAVGRQTWEAFLEARRTPTGHRPQGATRAPA
jgi:hypothetical protein